MVDEELCDLDPSRIPKTGGKPSNPARQKKLVKTSVQRQQGLEVILQARNVNPEAKWKLQYPWF